MIHEWPRREFSAVLVGLLHNQAALRDTFTTGVSMTMTVVEFMVSYSGRDEVSGNRLTRPPFIHERAGLSKQSHILQLTSGCL
jgi:hypothetical protein